MGISREHALECFRSDDLVGMGMEADAVRRRLNPEGVVSYAVACRVDCSGLANGGDADLEVACAAIAAAVENDATGVRLEGVQLAGGVGAVRDELTRLERMLRGLRRQFPQVWLEGPPATEVVEMAKHCELGMREVLARLKDAGLDAIAGDGIGLANEAGVSDWAEVHRAAHGLGMRTSAGMVFGAGETAEQRVDFLAAVRGLQEEMGGFAAFVPMAAAAPGGRELDGVTAVERLKTLAIARMFLDNVENVQADGIASGLKVLQAALRFGANDAGTVLVAGDGLRAGASEEDLRRIIRDAGFRPAERDAAYRAMMLS